MASNDELFPDRRSSQVIYRRVQADETSDFPASLDGRTTFFFQVETKLIAGLRTPAETAGDQLIHRAVICMSFSFPLDQPPARATAREGLLRLLGNALVVELDEADAGALADDMIDCSEGIASGMASTVGKALLVAVNVDVLVENLPQVNDDDDDSDDDDVEDDSDDDDVEDDGEDHYANVQFSPASEESIKGLEKITVDEVTPEECAVCLEAISVVSGATRLPCSHHFHGDCIIKWLHISKFCPLCRFEFS